MKYEDGFHWAGGVVERKTQELNEHSLARGLEEHSTE
jgi:hypothetical protein